MNCAESELAARCTAAFDVALPVRPERTGDEAFLIDLAMMTNPLAGLLPEPLLRDQGALHVGAMRNAAPEAMRRMIEHQGQAAGFAAITWNCGGSHLIDIAVHPAVGRRGIATSVLAAWLAIVDREDLVASLTVLENNPARALYERLGFAARGDAGMGAALNMERRPHGKAGQ